MNSNFRGFYFEFGKRAETGKKRGNFVQIFASTQIFLYFLIKNGLYCKKLYSSSPRFGAERVLLTAGLVWSLLTFWFQTIIQVTSPDLKLVVFIRIIIGAAQGVHFPALASISSKNLNAKDRSFFFSATTAGGAIGTLVTGTIGSYMNETFGWQSVFYSIGKVLILLSNDKK